MSTQAAGLAREPSFSIGSITIEPALLLVRNPAGEEFRVEPRVMQVLVALARANGRLLSRSELRNSCWDGRMTSSDAIERVIAQLRRLASATGGGFAVETVPKVGYRLVGACEPEREGPRSPGIGRRAVLGATIAAAGTLVAGAALYWRDEQARKGTREGPPTIAVLPFASEAPSLWLASFAAALSDEVRSDVSRVGDVRVIAQTSSKKVADDALTAQQIGTRLRADYLVEGQIGSSNGEIVTSVALVDTGTGSQLWTARESAPQGDPTSLRFAIVGDIIQHLAAMIPISSGKLPPIRRPDPDAYAMVQEANRLIDDARTSEMRGQRKDALERGSKAEKLARGALSIDPNYSAAFAVLAAITRNGWTPALAAQKLTAKQRIQASIAIIRRALVADPSDPAALTELGDFYRRFELRWDEAENLFRKALATDPSFVDAHWSYAYELGTLGRAIEGLDHALSVFELDPRNPFRRIALPRLLYVVGDRAGAMRRYQAELSADPDNLFLLRELYFMFLSESNSTDLQRLSQWISKRPMSPELSALNKRVDAARLALQGKPGALRALTDLEAQAFDSEDARSNATPQGRARDDLLYIFAIEYAWAAEADKAIAMLDRALAAKSLYWPATLPFGPAPFPSAVRNDPRYAALWERDPGLTELVRRRRSAVLTGQMAGFTPDGRKVVPAIPAGVQRRVQAALNAEV